MKHRLKLRPLVYLFLVSTVLFSCKKKVIEVLPVIELVKDMSISTAGDIEYFDFPSAQVGYAASDTTFIYKTVNGGTSWVEVPVELAIVGSNRTCKGLVFFDENTGLCLMDDHLFRTTNGGDNWSLLQMDVKFLEKSSSDVAVIGKCAPSLLSIQVFTSSNEGASFSFLGSIEPFNVINACNDFNFSSCHNNQLMLSFEDSDALYGIELSSGNNFTIALDDLNAYETPRAFYTNGDLGVLVGEQGVLQSNYSTNFYSRRYYGHTYTYTTVDGYDDLVICAGENTITTNLPINDDEWNEVFDAEGNGFATTFHKVSFIDASTFYISGSNGLIQKFSI